MVKENPLYTYETIVIDLSIARTGVEYSYSGNFIKAVEASDISANLDIAFNSSGNDTINLTKGRGIRASIIKMYLTNTAQAAKTITLLIATDDSLQIYDDGVVGDIDTIQEIIEPVAINHLPDKIISDQGLTLVSVLAATSTNLDSGTTVIYTVPANKIFYLAMLDINIENFAGGNSPRVWRAYDVGTIAYLGDATYTTPSGDGKPYQIYFNPWLKFVTSDTIRLLNTGVCVNAVSGLVLGYLKDA